MNFKRGDIVKAFDSVGDWAIYEILDLTPPTFSLIQNGPMGWEREPRGTLWTSASHHADEIGEIIRLWRLKKVNHVTTKLGKILYK